MNALHPGMQEGPGTELDALLFSGGSVVITCTATLEMGSTGNQLTILLADSGDSHVDTTVYISNLGGFSSQEFHVIPVASEPSVVTHFAPESMTAQPADSVEFDVDFTGTTNTPTSFLLRFEDEASGQLLGAIPVAINNTYYYVARGIDPDPVGGPLTYHLVDAPDGASIGPRSGVLRWEPSSLGNAHFIVRVQDTAGAYSDQEFTVSVTNVGGENQPPEITSLAPTQADVGHEYTYQVSAHDGDEEVLQYWLSEAPAGMTIDRVTGLVTWLPGPEFDGLRTNVTLHVFDRHGNSDTQSFTLFVAEQDILVNTSPSFTSTPPDVTYVGEPFIYQSHATDAEQTDLHYSVIVGPDAMVIDQDTGTLGWQPRAEDLGTHMVVLRVTDGYGGAGLQPFELTVLDANQPPTITSDPTQVAAILSKEWSYAVSAADPNGDSLTYRLDTAPPGMVLDNEHVIRWTPSEEGSFRVVVVVSDGRGGTTSQRFVIPVNVNAAPGILSDGPMYAGVGKAFSYTIVAVDPERDPLEYSLVSIIRDEPDGPVVENPGLQLNDNVLAGWTPASSDLGKRYTVTLQVTDDLGAAVTQSFTFEVVSNLLDPGTPSITSRPPWPAVVDQPWRYQLAADDPDGDGVQFSLVEGPAGMRFDDKGLEQRLLVWTPTEESDGVQVVIRVTDDSPNERTSLQTFNLPVRRSLAGNLPPDVISQAEGPARIGYEWVYQVEAKDPEGNALEYSFISAPDGMTIDKETGGIRWTATEAGNYKVQIWVWDGERGTSHGFTLPVTRTNHPPRIYGIPYDPIYVGYEWRYELRGYDPDGDELTWTIEDKRPLARREATAMTVGGQAIPSSSGKLTITSSTPVMLSWTPAADAGSYGSGNELLWITVSDGHGGSWAEKLGIDGSAGTFDVRSPSQAHPEPYGPAIVTVPSGPLIASVPWTYTAVAVDPDGVHATTRVASIELLDEDNQTLAAVVDADTIQFTADPTLVGSQLTLRVIAHELDTNGNIAVYTSPNNPPQDETTIFTVPIRVLARNDAPVITSTPANQATWEPVPNSPGSLRPVWTYDITATDADPDETLMFWVAPFPLITSNGQTETPNANPDFQFSNVHEEEGVWHATLTWRPADVSIKSQPIVIRVSDGAFPNPGIEIPDTSYWWDKPLASYDEQAFTITVSGGDTSAAGAPVITSLPDSTALVDADTYVYHITAIDPGNPIGAFTFAVTSPTTEVREALRLEPAADNRSATLRWSPSAIGNDTIIITVTDADGLKTTQTFLASAIEPYNLNEPPRIISAPAGPAARDLNYRYQVVAEDANPNDTLVYRLVQPPDGMTISASGLLSWTPPRAGTFEVVVQVWDRDPSDPLVSANANVHANEQRFDLRVLQNAPPQLVEQVPQQTAYIGEPLGGMNGFDFKAATEADDPNAGDTLSYVLDAGPVGARINADTGVIHWTPTNANPPWEGGDLGRHRFTVTVNDNHGARATQEFDVQVLAKDAQGNVIDHPPEITSTPRTSLAADRRYAHQVLARDADGDVVQFELVLPDDATRPAGMAMDQAGLIVWTPKASQVRVAPYAFQVRVTTLRGGVATTEAPVHKGYEVRVTRELENFDPAIVSRPKRAATADFFYAYQAAATDPDRDSVSWKLDQAPSGMTVEAASGRVSWKPAFDQVGEHAIELRATDPHGKSAVQRFTLTVRGTNLPPSIDPLAPNPAGVGEAYVYQVLAHDLEEGPLTYRVTSVAGTGAGDPPAGLAIHPRTGVLTWTPSAQQLGDHKLSVTVADDRGGATSETVTLSVYDPAINRPPVIDSPAPHPVAILANIGDPPITYAYAFHAVDDDNNGGTLRYGKLAGPGLIDSASGLYTWTPTAAGSHRVTLFVTDEALTVKQTFLVTSRGNAAPVLEPVGDQSLTRGQTLRIDLPASDVDGDRLGYILENAPTGMSVDERGVVLWDTPTDFDLGLNPDGSPAASRTYNVTARVRDLVGETEWPLERPGYASHAERTFAVTIHRDALAPVIPSIAFEKDVVTVGETAIVFVEATDNVGITTLTLTATAPGGSTQIVPLDFRGKGKLAVDKEGTWTFTAMATDAEGNAAAPRIATLLVEPDWRPPVLAFTSPRDGGTVTEPIEILGTVDDKETAAQYTLTARRTDGTGRAITLGTGGEVTNGLLGAFDPTLLDNGLYDLVLAAEDAEGNPSRRTIQVRVDGNLKPGAFSLQFTDLEIPVLGLPITVSRSYSTTRADRDLDFGYGWSLDFGKPEQEVDYAEGTTAGLGGRPLLENSRVEVTLTDGTLERFTFKPLPGEFNWLGQATYYVPYFEPAQGTSSFLQAPGDVKLLKIATGNGNHEYLDMYTGLSYNPASALFGGAYELTTRDGTQYGLDASGHDFAWIEDRNGNRLTYDAAGIHHSNGRESLFQRDATGRVASVTDPAGNAVVYNYEGGNLIGVTNRVGQTTTFGYESAHAHFLTDVVDAAGATNAGIEYAANGRVSEVHDAHGQTTVMSYSANLRTEEITDALGGVRAMVKDNRGNVVEEVDAEGNRTLRKYSSADVLQAETLVIGQLDSASNGESDDQTTKYLYNAYREMIRSTGAAGDITHYTYTKDGLPLTITDPGGNTAHFKYDERGNLIERINPTGVKTIFDRDSRGNLSGYRVGDTHATFEHNQYGELVGVTDVAGVHSTIQRDANGNRLGTSYTWVNPTNPVDTREIVISHVFDAEDRMTSTTSPDGSTTTSYDALDRPQQVTGPTGTTTNLYDARGGLIQVTHSDGRVSHTVPDDSRSGNGGIWTLASTVPGCTPEFRA